MAARDDAPALLLDGVAFWGLKMGFSKGILAALVAETTPADLKGSAFGLFNLASGAALLLASVLAGWLWQSLGAASTFLSGASFCMATLEAIQRLGKRNVKQVQKHEAPAPKEATS